MSIDDVERLRSVREHIEARIAAALDAAGDPDRRVTVVAVSKTHPASAVVAAMAAGFTDFGESYAVEFAAKAREIAAGSVSPRWHFIGQLQTNKVRAVAGAVDVYQSVDRPSLIAELARRAPGAAIMVQVNLAGLEGRGGATWDEAPRLLDAAREQGLHPIGVMGVAPVAAVPNDPSVAAAFRRLRALCDAEGLAECSMGMSDDLEVAVAEGSTMVRIGTAIFGSRPQL